MLHTILFFDSHKYMVNTIMSNYSQLHRCICKFSDSLEKHCTNVTANLCDIDRIREASLGTAVLYFTTNPISLAKHVKINN